MSFFGKSCFAGAAVVLATVITLWVVLHSRPNIRVQEILPASREITRCSVFRRAENYRSTQDWDGISDLGEDVNAEIGKKDIGPFFEQFRNVVICGSVSLEREVFLKLEFEYVITCELSKGLAKFLFVLAEDDSHGFLSYTFTVGQSQDSGLLTLDIEEAQELDAILAEYISK